MRTRYGIGKEGAGGSTRARLLAASCLVSAGLLLGPASHANPTGGTVQSGEAIITTPAAGHTQIEQTTERVVIDWDEFSIAAGETTIFLQPSAAAIALNRVTGGSLSQIYGTLSANGIVFLINPAGILIGPGGVVDVHGFLATTADIANDAFMAGEFKFDMPSAVPGASVVNRGTISVAEAGLAALVAPTVRNQGLITANLARVALAGAETFALDLYGDGLLSFDTGVPITQNLTAESTGIITAMGGRVVLTTEAAEALVGSVINVEGVIEAQTAGVEDGEIVLAGGSGGTVRVAGHLDTSGGNGSISLSGGTFNFTGAGLIEAGGNASLGFAGNITLAGDILAGAGVDITSLTGDLLLTGSGQIDAGGPVLLQAPDIDLNGPVTALGQSISFIADDFDFADTVTGESVLLRTLTDGISFGLNSFGSHWLSLSDFQWIVANDVTFDAQSGEIRVGWFDLRSRGWNNLTLIGGNILLGSNILTRDTALTFDGPVDLGASVIINTVNGGTGAGVTFLDAVRDSTDGTRDLRILAGTGLVQFAGPLGTGTSRLDDLEIFAGTIHATGDIGVADQILMEAANGIDLAGISTGTDIRFQNTPNVTVNGALSAGRLFLAGITDEFRALSFVTVDDFLTGAFPGAVTLLGGASVTNATEFLNLGGVTLGDDLADAFLFEGGLTSVTALTTLNGSVYTAGTPIRLGTVVLAGDTLIDSATFGVPGEGTEILFEGTVDAVTPGGASLNVNAGAAGQVRFLDLVGGTVPLNQVNVAAGFIQLSGVTSAGDQNYDALTLFVEDEGGTEADGGATTDLVIAVPGILDITGAINSDESVHLQADDLRINAPVTALGQGISLVADIIAFNGDVTGASILIRPLTPGLDIGLGGAAAGLDISTADFTRLFADLTTFDAGIGEIFAAPLDLTALPWTGLVLGGARIDLAGDIFTQDMSLTFQGPADLPALITIDTVTGGAGADVTFEDAVRDPADGVSALTILAGTGFVDFRGAVGTGMVRLGSLSVDGARVRALGNIGTTGSIFVNAVDRIDLAGVTTPADVTLSGAQWVTLSGALTADSLTLSGIGTEARAFAPVTLQTLTVGAFPGAVVLLENTDVVNPVTFANTGGVQLGDDPTDVFRFRGGLTSVASVTTLNGSFFTWDAPIRLGTVILGGDTVLDTVSEGASGEGADITVEGTLDAASSGGASFDVKAGPGSEARLLGAAGGTARLSRVTVDAGAIELRGVHSTDEQTYTAALPDGTPGRITASGAHSTQGADFTLNGEIEVPGTLSVDTTDSHAFDTGDVLFGYDGGLISMTGGGTALSVLAGGDVDVLSRLVQDSAMAGPVSFIGGGSAYFAGGMVLSDLTIAAGRLGEDPLGHLGQSATIAGVTDVTGALEVFASGDITILEAVAAASITLQLNGEASTNGLPLLTVDDNFSIGNFTRGNGKANLFGTIQGVFRGEAAALGRQLRLPPSEEFLFNECVIGVGCFQFDRTMIVLRSFEIKIEPFVKDAEIGDVRFSDLGNFEAYRRLGLYLPWATDEEPEEEKEGENDDEN